jgi:hypothetical protein
VVVVVVAVLVVEMVSGEASFPKFLKQYHTSLVRWGINFCDGRFDNGFD